MNSTRRDFWMTTGLLSLTIAATKLGGHRVADSLALPLESIPKQLGGWSMSRSQVLDDRTLSVLLPTSYLSRTYRRDNRQLDVFIAYYALQRAGESMHSPKNCLPGNGWEIWKQGTAMVPVNGKPARINKYSIQHVDRKNLVFYWYQSRKRVIASEYLGKALLIRDHLVDGRTAGSIVRVTVPDTEEYSTEGLAFATRLIQEVQRCFGS